MGIVFHAFPTLWHGVLHKHHWLLATLTSASSAPLPPTTFFPAWGRFQCRFCFGSLAPERVFACVLCHTGWVFDCVECHTVHVCMSRETEGTNPSLVLCCTALVLIGHWSCKRIRVAAAAAERETSELWGSHSSEVVRPFLPPRLCTSRKEEWIKAPPSPAGKMQLVKVPDFHHYFFWQPSILFYELYFSTG